MTLTAELGAAAPTVARYRTAVAGGSGTFEFNSRYDALWSWSVALGDLNGDGALDVVYLQHVTPRGVAVRFNQGDGTLGDANLYGTSGASVDVALGDLDGDGDLDLAVAVGGGSEVLVLRNKGDGTFDDPDVYPVEGMATGVALGDMDGDGDLDLVVAGGDFGTYVFRNK